MRIIKLTNAKNGDELRINPDAIDGMCPAHIPEDIDIKVPKGKTFTEIFMRGITIIVKESMDVIEKRADKLNSQKI